MVIQKHRRLLAEALRQLADGRITNDEFEDRALFRSDDPAVAAIQDAGWGLYSDYRNYRLEGRHRLPDETKRAVARCILFLHTSLEFEWPRRRWWWQSGLVLLALNCLTLGRAFAALHREYAQAGDIEVWAFIRKADYEAALRNPTLLSHRTSQPRP